MKFILWFSEIRINDTPIVGGKNASLGEMFSQLQNVGIRVPNGFAVTAEAYKYILQKAGIEDKIEKALEGLNTSDMANLAKRGQSVRTIIKEAELPPELKEEIISAYRTLCEEYGENTDVAVRSSATAEDLPDASFAGQQETYLNIRGEKALLEACKNCFASLFTNRAISYREDKGFNHFDVYLSIAVQKMVRSDLATSGVIFSIDTETGFKDAVFITASYGLGEYVVKGVVNPDEYYVFKPTLKKRFNAIISKKIGSKKLKLVYSKEGTREVEVPPSESSRFCLNDKEILKLADWTCLIEEHYKKPMDIEWAKDGVTEDLFIVQARPETVHSLRDMSVLETYNLKEEGKILLSGKAVGSKIGRGKVNVIPSSEEISRFEKDQVLVADMTDPDWEPIMKVASAIVTNKGGRTCHAAIVSRELGIPCIIGTENATRILKNDQSVTVSCAEGELGHVYSGLLDFEIQRTNLKELPTTKTEIMMNVGIPEKAFLQGQIPCDGVGLAREEFIINSSIGIHPLALVNFGELREKAKRDADLAEIVEKIEEKTGGYENKEEFFIDNLAFGIGRIAAGFYPNDVIVRLSDFKTNEYANLIGGSIYEPSEANPMIGWRGASRYYDDDFKPAFRLECQALRKAREEMGLHNIKAMIPFCRTPEEGEKVIRTMAEFGLNQGENGLEVYMMCEVPSNVIAAEEFSEIFDGFSIGSNDLTQLTLGLDRDSELVSHIYDERNIAVKRLVKEVIEIAKKRGRKIGICGQAPSDFPEFAAFLVECGIDSMSLNPDSVMKTKLLVAEKEKALGIKA
jgi:pyruvate,water dikinase